MDLEEGIAVGTDDGHTDPLDQTTPPPLNRQHSGQHLRHREPHNAEDHLQYDSKLKVEFVPPVEGTPAALALAANAAIKVSKFDKGIHKFRTLKRPKMKSLNLVKKLHKTTKSKRSVKHFSTNFKGKVIDGVHELYTLTAGMMLGIRYSIDQVMRADLPNTIVSAADFQFEETVPFAPKGVTSGPHITPAHSLAHTFEFKTYCPKVFKRMREFFDIDAPSYMQSVCGDYNFLEFISNSKSGQFFFYSHDGKYMLKTQTKEENKFMRRILPSYYQYMAENPHSLLVRILGMHRIEMYHLRRKVHFVIMTSVFDSPVKINSIYDLKGSLIGREATAKEREGGGVLKDMDLINDHRKLHLGSKKASFLAQLRKDAAYLAHNHIMDYSLLVGIHDRNSRGQAGAEERNSGTAPADSKSTPVNTRPHSNTPFRRSLHLDAEKAAQLASQLHGQHLSVPPSPGRTWSRDERSVASDGPMQRQPWTEHKDLHNGMIMEGSPAASVDNSVMSAEQINIHAVSMPSKEGSVGQLDDEDEDSEYDEEEEEEEDLDEGDSDDGTRGQGHQAKAMLRAASDGKAAQAARFSAMSDHEGHAYGNGISLSKPWTNRLDGGINSHIQSKGRSNEIYFVGVIDILQEYNTMKRAETMIKGLTNDVRQISSVDPYRYAQRFVKFMEDNID